MKIKGAVFLSHQINERTPVYGGGSPILLKSMKSIKNGDSCNTMSWSFSNHVGTHIDTPLHFIENSLSVSGLTPQDLIFHKTKLVKLKNIKPGYIIGPSDLTGVCDCDLLLIKTGFEKFRKKDIYWKDSVSLDADLADWLKKKCPSLRALGIDSISVSNLSRRQSGRETHKAFLVKNILLIEDMKLGSLKNNPNLVIIAPMLVEKADGAPCTVLGIYN